MSLFLGTFLIFGGVPSFLLPPDSVVVARCHVKILQLFNYNFCEKVPNFTALGTIIS